MRNSTLMAAAALCASATLFAQAPANDDCSGAIAIGLGTTAGTNINATSDAVFPMSCGLGGADADVWYSFVAPAANMTVSLCSAATDYDTKIAVVEGACGSQTELACNDDFCGLQSQINFAAVPGNTYYVRVGGFNSSQGNFELTVSALFDLEMVGVAEQTAGSGTLGTAGSLFTDGDFLRWNYNDINGTFAGLPAATILNVGIGGSEPIGVTPQIPGFNQVWAGSNPAGTETVYGPFIVGGPDQQVNIPAGLFNANDTVRLQGLILDPVNALGSFPVVATDNTIEWIYSAPPPSCVIEEDFENNATGAGSYPTGWSNGSGTREWSTNSGGTPSSTTGPTSARIGSQYMFTETSGGTVVGDVFEMITDTYTDGSVTELKLFLSRIGSDIGQLDIFIDDGSTLTPLASYSGTDASQSQGGLEWSAETIALPSPMPASYNFVIRYETLPVIQFTFYGDIAIDQFCLN